MSETSTNAGTTYAPRSPDLSSSSISNKAAENSSNPYQPEHIQQRTELRGGYAPRSPRISPYSETEPSKHNPDRRTSYVPPTLNNYASKSPEVVNFQRRHSAYIPPTDLPSLSTNYETSANTYTSPVYTRPQAGFFSTSEPPSQQGYRSGYSIPQSALTYQPPTNPLQHSQSLPRTTPNEFKPPYMRDLKLEDTSAPQLQNQAQKMEIDNGLKMENGGSMGDVPISLGAGGAGGASKGIEVKTKFPVARIKRIMQADEEVGKVAQVTPVVVSKALELFMISLVTKSADLARAGNSKRVTAVHLKKTIEGDEQFDFLNEIVAKVAEGVDAGQEKSKRSKSVDESESEEKPKAKKGRKKRGD